MHAQETSQTVLVRGFDYGMLKVLLLAIGALPVRTAGLSMEDIETYRKALTSNRELRIRFLIDGWQLSVSEFAEKHTQEIRRYLQAAGHDLDYEAAHQVACSVWRWAREDQA